MAVPHVYFSPPPGWVCVKGCSWGAVSGAREASAGAPHPLLILGRGSGASQLRGDPFSVCKRGVSWSLCAVSPQFIPCPIPVQVRCGSRRLSVGVPAGLLGAGAFRELRLGSGCGVTGADGDRYWLEHPLTACGTVLQVRAWGWYLYASPVEVFGVSGGICAPTGGLGAGWEGTVGRESCQVSALAPQPAGELPEERIPAEPGGLGCLCLAGSMAQGLGWVQ